MFQGFRGDLSIDPTGQQSHTNPRRRDLCRQRVLLMMQSTRYMGLRHCPTCGVFLLPHEADGWCCGHGKRRHWPWSSGNNAQLRAFYTTQGIGDVSRMINSLFTMGTVYSSGRAAGFTYHVGNHPPCLRVCGTLHNRLMRTTQNCWFIQDASYSNTFLSLAKRFQDAVNWFRLFLLRSNNPFASIAGLPPGTPNHVPPALDSIREGRISLVIENHLQLDDTVLRAVYVGPGCLAPERTLFHIGSGLAVSEDSPLWEILAYPYFHPSASQNEAWSPNYKSIVDTRLRHLQYLRSVMFSEPYFWISSRIAHQFILDGWARNEQRLVQVWRSPTIQGRIRGYLHRMNAAATLGNEKKIYLPSSVPGSYRYQQRFYHDAIHMAAVLGNPHLFITMTANPQWPEVTALLRDGESASTRLDVMARVFDMKRRELLRMLGGKDILFKGHRGFKGVVWVTEWQLCGLPHVHMAVILGLDENIDVSPQSQLTLMDTIISANYPPEGTTDFDLVETFMVHNAPCKSCLRPNKNTGVTECRFHYPKPVNDTPRVDRKGFPLYVRGPSDTLVVPHNIKALRALQCHNNWEWVYSSGCIAYLYKYFTKGVDSAGMRISEYADEIAAHRRSRVLTASESTYRILNYDINFRKPASVLCKFSLPRRSQQDRADTNARRYIEGEPDDLIAEAFQELEDDLDAIDEDGNEQSPLDGGPLAASVDNEYNGHLDYYLKRPFGLGDDMKFSEFYQNYYRIPSGYSRYTNVVGCEVDEDGDFWKARCPLRPVLTRLPWISPVAGELYYLRKLIMHKPARSWDDFYCGCETFREAAQRENLVHYDNEPVDALRDAVINLATPNQVRDLFVTILLNEGGIGVVLGKAWDDPAVRDRMCFDFLPSEDRGEAWNDATRVSELLCLCELKLSLLHYGRDVSLDEYGLPNAPATVADVQFIVDRVGPLHPVVTLYAIAMSLTISVVSNGTVPSVRGTFFPNHQREIIFYMDSTPVEPSQNLQELRDSLNPEQQHVFQSVMTKLALPFGTLQQPIVGNVFFVDAPAGSGKTYVANVIAKHIRSSGKICLACATTGIAALMFHTGRTAHSLFGIKPVDDAQVLDGPSVESDYVVLLRNKKWNSRLQILLESSLIIFDELPMARRAFVEAVDYLFRVLMSAPTVPFGGKVFLCLGDFRQISPIKDQMVSRTKATDCSALQYSSTAFSESIRSSALWPQFIRLHLIHNVRAVSDPSFHEINADWKWPSSVFIIFGPCQRSGTACSVFGPGCSRLVVRCDHS